MAGIDKFYEIVQLDEDFDDNFYSSMYPETKNFYQPYCKLKNISDKKRLFFHYSLYGNQGVKRHKNKSDLINHYSEFKPPNGIEINNDTNLCIICHVHYIDIWEYELKNLIRNIDLKYDLFITINNLSYKDQILKDFPTANILHVENIGSDIYPFIHTINFINNSKIKYEYVLKLHTKKSSNRNQLFAKIWRTHLYKNLCNNIKYIIFKFKSDKNIGMIGAPNNLMRLSNTEDQANLFYTDKYRKILEIKDDKLEFLYGTMFVVEFNLINSYLGKNKITINDFEPSHKSNNSVPHAFERLFGNMVRDCNKNIYLLGQNNI